MAANLSATRDHLHTSDKGELSDPQQTAGFTVDPFLTPISTSSMPHPMHPDPTPSTDPELFDASTRHPNTHYDPAKKLSKKKRNKKLGLGAQPPHPTGLHAGGRTFSEREQVEHDRAERRDSEVGHGEEEEEEDDEDDEDGDETQEEQQSHAQHADNRVTGSEQSGQKKPDTKSTAAKEAGGDKEQHEDAAADKSGSSSLLQRAGGLLSSAQETASGVLASASGTVGGLLSKVGIGAGKEGSSSKEENDQATKEEA